MANKYEKNFNLKVTQINIIMKMHTSFHFQNQL